MLGHITVKDSPSIMSNDEETIEHAKGQRGCRKEVYCRDAFPMIAEERRPRLCRLRISGSLSHPAQHGSFGDVEAKHLQFAMNAWGTPGWILGDHAEDELAQLFADALPARANLMPREPSPIHLESGTVPSHDSLRLNEDQHLPPTRPKPPQHHPEQPVRRSEPRLRMPPLQDRELLPKRKVFQEEVTARTKDVHSQSTQKPQQTT